MKKLLLWVIIALMFVSSVNAVLTDGLVSHYTMNNVNYTDSEGFSNGTNSGTTSETGILDNASLSNANSEDINFSGDWVDATLGWSVSFWFKPTSQSGKYMPVISQSLGKDEFDFTLSYLPALSVWRFYNWTGSVNNENHYDFSPLTPDDSWEHYVLTVNTNGTILLYRNATANAPSATGSGSPNFGSGNQFLDASAESDTGVWYSSAYLDEVAILNRPLEASEVTQLFNSGTPLPRANYDGAPPVVNDTINLSASVPVDQSQFNGQDISFNVSANAALTWDARLYINDTLNASLFGLSSGTNVVANFNVSFSVDGAYAYFISANTTGTEENTTSAEIFIDTADPVIVTDLVNNSIYLWGNLTAQFNLTDNVFLNSYNITFDGVEIQSDITLSGVSAQVNFSRDVSNLTNGEHIFGFRLADGHTARVLGGNYSVSNCLFDDCMKYGFYDGGEVRIDNLPGSIFDTFTSEKSVDRYTFTYEPEDIKSDYNFSVTSDLPIKIAKNPDTVYKQWLVMGNHWLDFYLPGEPNQLVNMTRVSDYEVTVIVSGLTSPQSQLYSSVGDLNVIQENFTFVVVNASVVYSGLVSELENQNISLRVNTSSSLVSGVTSQLLWNNTFMNLTNASSSDAEYFSSLFLTPQIIPSSVVTNFTWNMTVFGPVNNETILLNFSQTIFRIGIDNCTNYNVTAVNFTIVDENTLAEVNSSIDGNFEVFIDSISQFRSFNLSWEGASRYGICIFPADANYTTNAQFDYSAPLYKEKTYYFLNTTLDNVSNNITLYLTLNTTLVTLIVTDENDNPLEDYFIHVQSYDVGTDSFKVTEIAKTDFNGEAFAEMLLLEQWYQFMIVDPSGLVVLQTGSTKLTSEEKKFRVTLGSDYFESYDKVLNVQCSISFNNATDPDRFIMDFIDTSGDSVTANLTVFRVSPVEKVVVNSSAATSSSGSLIVTVNDTLNATYLGVGEVTIDGEVFVCGIPVSYSYDRDFEDFGLEGLFFTFILALVLCFASIWDHRVAVLALPVGVFVSIMMGISFWSWPVLVGYFITAGIVVYRLNR